jgi:hypothetical protein
MRHTGSSTNCQTLSPVTSSVIGLAIRMIAHFIGSVPQNSELPLMASEDTPSRRLCHPLKMYSAGRIFCEAKKRKV